MTTSTQPPRDSNWVGPTVSALGAATVVGVFAFGAGVLGLDLKLWYRRLPVTFVGALSHSQITTTTVSAIVVPALLGAIGLGLAISAARGSERTWTRWMPWHESANHWRAAVRVGVWTVAVALIETSAVLVTLLTDYRNFKTGVFRPYPEILATDLSLIVVANLALVLFLYRSRLFLYRSRPSPAERSKQTAITAFVLLLALLPTAAAIWSCLHFPAVQICEPPGVGPTTASGTPVPMVGNLVGTDGQFLYVAQYFGDPVKQRSIEAIPISSVTREYVFSTTTSPVTGETTSLYRCPLR